MKPSAAILHLEDSELDAELVEMQLRRAGLAFTVDRVWDRDGFAAALRTRRFDIILADFVLPTFDGLAALEIAREIAPEVPFIFLSGTLGEETAIESLKRGAVDYVLKQRLERLPVALARALAENRERQARRAAEAALRESEALFRHIADSAPAIIFMTDAAGRLVFLNHHVATLLAVEPATVLATGWGAILAPDSSARLAGSIERALGERAGMQCEAEAHAPGGETIWLRIEALPRFDAAGALLGLTGAGVDITEARLGRTSLEARIAARTAELSSANRQLSAEAIERERSEIARRDTEAQLHQAQKMETVGQLTGGVAHDFNNLLMVILTTLGQLRRSLPEDPRMVRLLDAATQAADRGASLTQRLLAFSRRQNLEVHPVDLKSLVEGMQDLVMRTNGPGITVVTALAPDLPLASADANQLELALLNLAVNARDAMPDGGTLRITLDMAHSPAAPDLKAGDYLRLAFEDTGTGMDAVTLERAIEPFFSTKEVGKGTGLGLSMIHGLAEQLGGAFRLASRLGEGTRAELWLPIDRQAMVEGAKADSVDDGTVAAEISARAILVVDDDALVRMGVVDMLEDLGHRVVEAGSGAQALDILRKGDPIDLMITDHSMPGMTGMQLAHTVLVEWPDLPILLATGYVSLPEEDVLKLPRLSKPYDQDQLSRKIATLLQG